MIEMRMQTVRKQNGKETQNARERNAKYVQLFRFKFVKTKTNKILLNYKI